MGEGYLGLIRGFVHGILLDMCVGRLLRGPHTRHILGYVCRKVDTGPHTPHMIGYVCLKVVTQASNSAYSHMCVCVCVSVEATWASWLIIECVCEEEGSWAYSAYYWEDVLGA
jgi:hypothetical protein